MVQRNKIIVPTEAEPEESLETPHFDAEETLLAARPVVPLSQDDIDSHGDRRVQGAAGLPLARRFPLLALVIIAAVCAGAAGGLAVALYQGRQKAQDQEVATQPPSRTEVDTRFTQQPAEEGGQTQLPSVQTVSDADKTTIEQPAARTDSAKTDEETAKQPAARGEKPDKGQASSPPVARKKSQDEREVGDIEQKKPKPPRRRPRVDEDTGDDIPRRVERASQELNRIREIFEGTQP